MVRTSGIREKLRSGVLKELARERHIKKTKPDRTNDLVRKDETDSEDEEQTKDDQSNSKAKLKSTNSGLLHLLPKPKNSSSFGANIRLDKLLKLPDRADDAQSSVNTETDNAVKELPEDGMIEVDVSKVVNDSNLSYVKELTIEKSSSNNIVVPRGKEKQKNQITYLAQLGKANELKRKEDAALGRMNKAAARSKYGW